MEAAAFFAEQGGVHDQGGHGGQVAEFEEVGGQLVAPVKLGDFPLQIAQPGGGALEAFVGADDAHVVPHQPADFVPVVVDNHQLIHGHGVAAGPGGEREVVERGVGGGRRLAGDGRAAAVGEDAGFEERVAGEPVRAVQPGAGDLADGIEPAQRRRPIFVRLHAAALVMRRRDDRDGLPRDVDPESEARLVDIGKALAHELRRLVRDVEIHAARAGSFHLGVDGAGHDVARREFLPRVVFLHESAALPVDQPRPFAPHRLRDEETPRLRVKEARRVKLDKLHVRDPRPRAPGHGHAVAGRDAGVGRVKIDLSAAAGRQHHAVAAQGGDLAGGLVEHVSAEAAVGAGRAELAEGDEVHGDVIFENGDGGRALDGGEQGALDLASGEVAGVEDAPFAVAALAGEVQLVRAVGQLALVERHAKLDQLPDARRAVRDDASDHRLVAQPGARLERVFHMQLERILRARHARDPALRPRRVRLRPRPFRDDRHAPQLRRFQRKTQPRDAGADDDEIEAGHRSHRLSISRVWPKKTASANTVPRRTSRTGRSVSASAIST